LQVSFTLFLDIMHRIISHFILGFVTSFVIICVIHLTNFSLLFAQQLQVTAQLADTSVQRGTVVRLPIRVAFRQAPAQLESLRFTLRFAPSALAVQRAIGGGGNVMQCALPQVENQFVNLSVGAVRVSCATLSTLPTAQDAPVTLAVVELLTLAGPDAVTSVSIDSVVVNGRFVPFFTPPRPAQITLQGAPLVAGQFADGIGQNYPNPVPVSGATFPYTVAETGNVTFELITSQGVVVREYPPEFRRQGRYLWNYRPEGNLPSGLYVLRMTTTRGVYLRGFVVAR
jgi:hypothetical protein